MTTLANRHFSEVSELATDGCWPWPGYINERGYGYTTIAGRFRRAHRVSYERFNGPIPAGMTVDHICHNLDPTCPGRAGCPHRRCVNPRHLDLVTEAMNRRRARESRAACRHGHPRTEANTYVGPDGRRTCRECTRIGGARRRAAKKKQGLSRAARVAVRDAVEPGRG